MITTKRQILRDSDRFGGYGRDRSAATAVAEPDSFSAPSDISSTRSYAQGNSIIKSDPEPAIMDITRTEPIGYAQTEVEQPLYSTRETITAPELPKRPERERKPLDQEDLMPSIKTRRMMQESIEESPAVAEINDVIPERRAGRQVSPRTKILLFVYVAVALVLAIAVLATGISISKASAKVAALTNEITQKQAIIAEQETEIAFGTDPDSIRQKAIDLGMTYATEPAGTASLIERVEYPTPTPHTNGFDGFCDWVSSVVM